MSKPVDISKLKNAVVSWPQQNETSMGPLSALRVEVPPTIGGRLCIYKVPACESCPEGYFVTLDTGPYYDQNEPGCQAWERTLLFQAHFTAAPVDLEDDMDGAMGNAVEYLHPEVPFNDSQLNPNDYAAMREGGK